MRAVIRDTEIFFDIDGSGLVPDGIGMRERPTAFLVHGGPGGDHTGFKARFGALSERMQLVFFDHRGQGRSARGSPDRYTLDENVEDMEALRRYLGLGSIISIGTSYGGMVAMAHAARYPDVVSHLVLGVTAAHAGHLVRAKEIVAARGTLEQIALFDDVFSGRVDTPEKMCHYFERMGPLFARRYDPELHRRALRSAIFSPEAQNRAYGPGGCLRSFDLRPELGSITAPTLILAARHDWICAPEFSEEIQRLIPGSDLRVFEESGHFISSDEPQKVLDVIAGFVVYNIRKLEK
jgi:proline iminopeptidase